MEQIAGRRPMASPGMRALGRFWGVLLLVCAGGAAVLQWLGPPHRSAPVASAALPAAATLRPAPMPRAAPPNAGLAEATGTADTAPGPAANPTGGPAASHSVIPPPDPALLEPSTTYPGGMLPQIAADGRTAMRVYAAPFDAAAAGARPRVALLLSGVGMSETDSEEAIHLTPPAVSLAVSPYAFRPERLLADARAIGHEMLVSLPLEPERYPIDDPGNRALLTGNPPAVNQQRLEWALTRFAGYVGATSALNGMRGERFAGASELLQPVLQDLSQRGLLYIDARPGAVVPAPVVGRGIDVLVDEPAPVRAEIEANLARLEQIAHDKGAAIGLVGMPRPVTLDRIAAWAATLGSRGFVLVPVTAVTVPPRPAPATTATAKP